MNLSSCAAASDYRRQRIGKALLEAAIEIAQQAQIQRFEAWTRDDASRLIHVFAHFDGEFAPAIRRTFNRMHECHRYDLLIDGKGSKR